MSRGFNTTGIGICVNFPVIFKFVFSQWSHEPIERYILSISIHRVHLPSILNLLIDLLVADTNCQNHQIIIKSMSDCYERDIPNFSLAIWMNAVSTVHVTQIVNIAIAETNATKRILIPRIGNGFIFFIFSYFD